MSSLLFRIGQVNAASLHRVRIRIVPAFGAFSMVTVETRSQHLIRIVEKFRLQFAASFTKRLFAACPLRCKIVAVTMKLHLHTSFRGVYDQRRRYLERQRPIAREIFRRSNVFGSRFAFFGCFVQKFSYVAYYPYIRVRHWISHFRNI